MTVRPLEDLLEEISTLLGCRVTHVVREEPHRGHTVCDQAPCPLRRVAFRDRCTPACGDFRPEVPWRTWHITAGGRTRTVANQLLRNPQQLSAWRRVLADDPRRPLLTRDDGFRLVQLLNQAWEAATGAVRA